MYINIFTHTYTHTGAADEKVHDVHIVCTHVFAYARTHIHTHMYINTFTHTYTHRCG